MIVLGVIAFCGLFAEGAVSNWGGVMLHQVRHASFTVAALVTAGFGAGMLIGRFPATPRSRASGAAAR